MNWHYILSEVLLIFLKTAVILGAYFLTKYYVQNKRKNEKKKASKFEIILYIISVIVIAAIIGSLLAGGRINNSFIYSIIIVIPALWGLLRILEIDAKLTPEERKKLKEKMDEEEERINLYPDEP